MHRVPTGKTLVPTGKTSLPNGKTPLPMGYCDVAHGQRGFSHGHRDNPQGRNPFSHGNRRLFRGLFAAAHTLVAAFTGSRYPPAMRVHPSRHLAVFAALGCSVLVSGLLATAAPAAAETNTVHVALVFDDGPFPEHAPKLMEFFARENIHVTFSLVASNVLTHPETAKAIAAAGHEIANHSFGHLHPKSLSDAELEHEIVAAQKVIAEKSGFTPKWYWPPFIEIDDRVRAMAKQAGIGVYPLKKLVVSMDYDRSVNAGEIWRHATSGVTDGTVILFHEWRDETLEQLPAILAELRKQGCVFETFSELDVYNQGATGGATKVP
jgi:peptidoglycan-N-acetylglucosamine deacetylase